MVDVELGGGFHDLRHVGGQGWRMGLTRLEGGGRRGRCGVV